MLQIMHCKLDEHRQHIRNNFAKLRRTPYMVCHVNREGKCVCEVRKVVGKMSLKSLGTGKFKDRGGYIMVYWGRAEKTQAELQTQAKLEQPQAKLEVKVEA
jgi:hypothetical protein